MPTVPSRQCGRCRGLFEGDPTADPARAPEWWLCGDCESVLLPRRAVRPVGSA